MDSDVCISDEEIFEVVRKCYHETNKEYIEEQIRIAKEYAEKSQDKRQFGILTSP